MKQNGTQAVKLDSIKNLEYSAFYSVPDDPGLTVWSGEEEFLLE